MRIVNLAPPDDTARVQQLLDRCSDYYELHEGWPTPADAAEFELTFVPPGLSVEQFYFVGLQEPDGTLNALAQVLRDYPEVGQWWIGLLVVAPGLRSAGLGSALMRHVDDAAMAAGVSEIRLIVSPENPRGARFWQSAGFHDEGREVPVTARSGHTSTGRFMSKPIRSQPPSAPPKPAR